MPAPVIQHRNGPICHKSRAFVDCLCWFGGADFNRTSEHDYIATGMTRRQAFFG